MNFPLLLRSTFTVMLLLIGNICLAQLQASFTSPTSVCLQETISVTNTSQGASSFIWDFCDKDLEAIPTGNNIAQLPNTGLLFYASMRMTFENGNWYGLVSASDRNTFFRLDFGPTVTSPPTVTDIGNLGAGSPLAMDLIRVNNILYGFISTGYGGSLTRITWGNGITQSPTDVTSFGSLGIISSGESIKAISSLGENYVFVTNASTNNIAVIQFGNSFSNSIQGSKLIGGSAGLVGPWGIDIVSEGSDLFGLLACRNLNKVYRMSFGASLFNDPTFTDVGTVNDGTSLKLVQEGNNYVGLVRSRTLGLYRVRFGTSMNNAPAIDHLGLLGVLQNESRSLELVKDFPSWHAFTVDVTTARVNRLDFYGDCLQDMALNSSNENNFDQAYTRSGNYSIELTAIDNAGNRSTVSVPIAVIGITSTDVTILSDASRCFGVANTFQTASTLPITQYDWNFNNEATSSLSNPLYQFNNAGSNIVTVRITDSNGCHNNASANLTVFNLPLADFSQPQIGTKSCTLQDYNFTNQSSYDLPSNPSWTWALNGVEQSVTQNFNHLFDQTGTYSISLKAEIPGCSSTISKDFVVDAEGVLVDFIATEKCEGGATIFTNTSVGVAAGYQWDYGDAQYATLQNGNHQYSSIGTYPVTLEVTNSVGCVNSKTQNITITSTPQPSFFIDLPPFSCAATSTQFHDDTSLMPDSNIESWSWEFKDGTGASSIEQMPSYIFSDPGDYNVMLEVTSNYGCTGSIEKQITIAESPKADFSYSPACLNTAIKFNDTSSSGIQSWSWDIDNTPYTTQNPAHSFSLVGDYSASLTVKGQNNCEGTMTKTIEVKPIPIVNFKISPACSDKETIFTDQTIGSDKPASWNWNFGNGNLATTSQATHTFPSIGSFPVNMAIVTESGCAYSTSKNVVVVPPPVASFTATPNFGSPPLQVQFTNTSTNVLSLLWEFNDNDLSTSTKLNPTITFSELGEYPVKLTATNNAGCTDTFSKTIKVLVPVIDVSLLSVNIQQSIGGVGLQPIVSIKNNSNVNISFADFFITGSSGLQFNTNVALSLPPDATKQIPIPVEIRSREEYICIQISVSNDISSNDNFQCLNLVDESVLVSPYPNPTSGAIFFEAILKDPGTGSLQILDSRGQLIIKRVFENLKAGMNQLELDFSERSPGLYFAIWDVNGKRTDFRFLVQ